MDADSVCKFCGNDLFEYVTLDDARVPVAVTCCDEAIRWMYNKMIGLDAPKPTGM